LRFLLLVGTLLVLRGNAAASTPLVQQAALSDAFPNEGFGSSAAISGDTAVVGAYARANYTGAAYVFARSGSSWSPQATLLPAGLAEFDFFGLSVAVSGDTAVVGAYGQATQTGAAYVFVRNGSSWTLQQKLQASDASTFSRLGYSVAVDGNTVALGAYAKNGFTGAAYVFVRNGEVWSQQQKLVATGATLGDTFGYSLAISGDTLVVGRSNGTSNPQVGAAYVFTRSGSSWSQQQKLLAADGVAGDFFGVSVAVHGDTALVGATNRNNNIGAAYVFARNGTAWSQQQLLVASDGAQSDQLGGSLAVQGDVALIAARTPYVFVRSGTSWQQQQKLPANNSRFVALDGDTALVSASGSFDTVALVFVPGAAPAVPATPNWIAWLGALLLAGVGLQCSRATRTCTASLQVNGSAFDRRTWARTGAWGRARIRTRAVR